MRPRRAVLVVQNWLFRGATSYPCDQCKPSFSACQPPAAPSPVSPVSGGFGYFPPDDLSCQALVQRGPGRSPPGCAKFSEGFDSPLHFPPPFDSRTGLSINSLQKIPVKVWGSDTLHPLTPIYQRYNLRPMSNHRVCAAEGCYRPVPDWRRFDAKYCSVRCSAREAQRRHRQKSSQRAEVTG